jgi:predicted nuclease of predicted toxin-antitoxin system
VTELFIRLYLDEDVDVLVADLLRARGFVATTTLDEGQRGKSDPEQLAYAVSQGKALVSHNRGDFETLAQDYLARGDTHHDIILPIRRPPNEVAQRLARILNDLTADEMQNLVLYT